MTTNISAVRVLFFLIYIIVNFITLPVLDIRAILYFMLEDIIEL